MKGVSDKDAQNNKKIKGDKNNFKKPLQVLHISKKDSEREQEKFLDEKENLSNIIQKDTKTIKPQIIESPINEEKENYSTNIKFDNKRYQNCSLNMSLF